MAWNVPAAFVAGAALTAAQLNQVRESLKAIGDPWTSYTPTLAGVAGTVSARYVAAGKWVTVEFLIAVTGAASATFVMSKPVPSADNSAMLGLGQAMALDGALSTTRRSLTVVNNGAADVFFIVDSLASTATVGVGVPWVWASGDTIGGVFSYRAA